MDDDINIFQIILDKAGEEFYLIRPNGALVCVNESAAKSLGYTVKELSNMGMPDFDPLFRLILSRKSYTPPLLTASGKFHEVIPLK